MKLFEQMEGFVSGNLRIFKLIISIFKLETRLAGLSVFPLMFNLCMLFIVVTTIWLSTMFLLGYCALLALGNILLAIFSVLLLNIGLFIVVSSQMKLHLKNMSFEKTREFFSKNKSEKHDELEKTDGCPNNGNG